MKVSELHILEKLYGEILIPEAVFTELTANENYAKEAEEIKNSAFIRLVTVCGTEAVRTLRENFGLDLGESEAIVCAEDHKADILLMDEALGRSVARAMGLRVRGTIGVLLLAFDKGILSADDVDTAVDGLRSANRRISEKLCQYAHDYVRNLHKQ